jgi:surfactin synthase thioesterase subunit
LFIWGKKDFAVGPEAVEASHGFIQDEYTFLALDGSHWLVQSNYTEVKAAISDHIERHFYKSEE